MLLTIVLVAALGILIRRLLKRERTPEVGILAALILLSLLALPNPVLFLPFLSKIALLYRLPLVVACFASTLVAYVALSAPKKRWRAGAIALWLILAGGVINDYSAGSSPELGKAFDSNTLAFSASEQEAMKWAAANAQGKPVRSDFYAQEYLSIMQGAAVNGIAWPNATGTGLEVLRLGEFRDHALVFTRIELAYIGEPIRQTYSASDLARFEAQANRVYDGGDAIAYLPVR
jgi:hypothetical protein